MTSHSERDCVRGCKLRDGRHMATCADWGKPEDEATCQGCVPRPARDGALICERCYRSLQRHLEDAADVVGHIRSMADPLKAAVYSNMPSAASKPEAPAPVAAALLDAGDSVVRLLAEWCLHFTPEHDPLRMRRMFHGLDAGDAADVAYDTAVWFSTGLLQSLDDIVNDAGVKPFADAVLTRHTGDPAGWPWWSVADALSRFRLDDRPRWATMPCPGCDCKTVRVTPPRRVGMSARYTCTTCEWDRTDRDDGGFWAEAFADVVPAAA